MLRKPRAHSNGFSSLDCHLAPERGVSGHVKRTSTSSNLSPLILLLTHGFIHEIWLRSVRLFQRSGKWSCIRKTLTVDTGVTSLGCPIYQLLESYRWIKTVNATRRKRATVNLFEVPVRDISDGWSRAATVALYQTPSASYQLLSES